MFVCNSNNRKLFDAMKKMFSHCPYSKCLATKKKLGEIRTAIGQRLRYFIRMFQVFKQGSQVPQCPPSPPFLATPLPFTLVFWRNSASISVHVAQKYSCCGPCNRLQPKN